MKQLYIQSKNRTVYQLNRFKRYLNRFTAFEIALSIISSLIVIWLVFSFVDIVNNNLTTYTYAEWNLIDILSNKF